MPIPNTLVTEIDDTITVDTEYFVPWGVEMIFSLNGTAVWEYSESGMASLGSDTAWVEFSGGSGKNFLATVPHPGHLRVNVGSGTITVKAFPSTKNVSH